MTLLFLCRLHNALLLTLMMGIALLVGGCATQNSFDGVEPPNITTALISAPPETDRLLTALREHRFTELEKALNTYQTAYSGNPLNDRALQWVFTSLTSVNASYQIHFDAWVQQMPRSYNALGARAIYLVKLGYEARGYELASNVSKAQFEEMDRLYDLAWQDIDAQEKINPDFAPAHCAKFIMAASTHRIRSNDKRHDNLKAHFDDAVDAHPYDSTLYDCYINFLTPRWGGSRDAMKELAKNTQVLWEHNPHIADIAWRVWEDDGDFYLTSGQFADAISLYSKALAVGENSRILASLGQVYVTLNDYEKALPYFERALVVNPFLREAYQAKANLTLAMSIKSIASGNVDAGIAIGESAPEYYRWQPMLPAIIGKAYQLKGDLPLAADYYEKSTQYDPSNFGVWQNLTEIHLNLGNIAKALNACSEAVKLNASYECQSKFSSI